MKGFWKYSMIPVACVTLAACGGKDKEPTGQVVATVDGEEITVTELKAELAGVSVPDPKTRKVAEQQALQVIINRKVVAQAAREQKLDKTPEFALQEQRATEGLLANAFQKKIVAAVPTPTADEASRYMAANPNVFGERKIYIVDQIRIAMPRDPKELTQFEPLKTFEDVEALLKAKNMNYQRGSDRIDAVGSNPKMVAAISALPSGEVFVIPAGRLVLINRVRETQVQPFTGEQATKYAIEVMKQQRTQEALDKQFGGMLQRAKADVKYNAQYKPAPPPKLAPGKAAAPPPKA